MDRVSCSARSADSVCHRYSLSQRLAVPVPSRKRPILLDGLGMSQCSIPHTQLTLPRGYLHNDSLHRLHHIPIRVSEHIQHKSRSCDSRLNGRTLVSRPSSHVLSGLVPTSRQRVSIQTMGRETCHGDNRVVSTTFNAYRAALTSCSALWFFEALVLARDLMTPSSDNEPIQLPPLPSASNVDWPTSPQQIDPWSPVSPLEPPRSGPQPLLPESPNRYDDDAQELPDPFDFGFSREASSDSSGQHVADLSPQQAPSSACSHGRRGAVSHLDPVGSRCVSPKKQPIRK